MNFEKLRPEKYLKYLNPTNLFSTQRTREILSANPTVIPHREEATDVKVHVFDFNESMMEERSLGSLQACYAYKNSGHNTWINIDGLRKADVESVCEHFGIHPLIIEDILSLNQRPKMEETENGHVFCLLNMLYYNEELDAVEQEQISIVLGKEFVISFQEDAHRDVFNPLREKLKISSSKIRQRSADYLCYSMLDMIVDHYYLVMEKLSERIEEVEEIVSRGNNTKALTFITRLRKELIILKRNFTPVRELLNNFLRTDSPLIDPRTEKYFKDVYDHIVQAIDLVENYRDVIVSMQDLHINNVNMRMNEVMKVMAIVTCLLAPPTVIGGVFGMNFAKIPFADHNMGFLITVGVMLIIPAIMLFIFKRRGWF